MTKAANPPKIKQVNDQFSFNKPVVNGKYDILNFFGSFDLPCIFLTFQSPNIDELISRILFSPLITFHFYRDNFFAFCTQNLCCVFYFDIPQSLSQFFIKIPNSCDLLPVSNDDYVLMNHFKTFLETKAETKIKLTNIKLPPKGIISEIETEVKYFNRSFFDQYNLNENDQGMNYSKYFFISKDVISSFYIRRNYYSLASFKYTLYTPCPENEFNEYQSNDFIFLRFLESKNLRLLMEKKTRFICVLKLFDNEDQWKHEKTVFEELKEKSVLTHQNIINCFGFIDTSPPCFLYQFYPNYDLRKFLKNNPSLHDTRKTSIAYQILGGLDYLHQNGIIHQDLMIENIFVSTDNNIVLSHFSNCCIYIYNQSNDQENEIDIFNFQNSLSFQDDLCLYGLILFEISTNSPPFEENEKSPLNLLDKVQKNIAPKLPYTIGSIIKLYELCVRPGSSNRVSSVVLLWRFMKFYYYFIDANVFIVLNNNDYRKQLEYNVSIPRRRDIDYLFDMSEQNDAESIYFIGFLYKNGIYFENNENLAFSKFSKAANLGYPEAIYEIAVSYLTGTGLPSKLDSPQRVINGYNLLMQNQNLQNPKIFYELAKCYSNDTIIQRNDQMRDDLLHKAAELSYSPALKLLGDLNSHFNKEKSEFFEMEKAIEFYNSAALCGDGDAYYSLYKIYTSGYDNQKFHKKQLFEFLIMAISLGSSDALLEISKILNNYTAEKKLSENNATGTKQTNNSDNIEFPDFNVHQFIGLLEIGSIQNNVIAFRILGHFYLFGEVIEKDITKAINYLTKAADAGDSDSQFTLAKEYFEHVNIDQNLNKAYQYYTAYKKSGGKNIINDLEDSSKNTCPNISLWKKKENDVEIDFYNGIMPFYVFDHEIIENYTQDNRNEQCYNDALYYQSRIMMKEIPKRYTFQNLINVLEKSARTNCDAQVVLGKIYAYGIGVSQNIQKSLELFEQASNAGNNEAHYYLSKVLPKNENERSLDLLILSASNGFVIAECKVGQMFLEDDVDFAVDYLVSAIKKKNMLAHYYLGLIYERSGLSANSIDLYKEAASVCCFEAKKHLENKKINITYEQNNCQKNYIHGHFFECLTCGIFNGIKICAYCARTKHEGHILIDLGEMYSEECDDVIPIQH
ncbi:hypothetical protein TRFO_13151 [Tritrichomonas foetus]|uniref:Protein kinase domain-containing protein n=1 Tax=Tritrichomonas foetus TaxID=1144522 RepID=A0A1J4KZ73_9EUKA|nr:hypothetical protein TRFO_13151 [Tritrichomonas foetus]|eukprot:OHT16555.1 hypothetical protein TRFO_13151 [Tritrichomonas foetus]